MSQITDPWIERLSEYVDDELDAPTREALEAHLATCTECRQTRDELRRVVAQARRVG
jgi:anti-sigma factor RsiW